MGQFGWGKDNLSAALNIMGEEDPADKSKDVPAADQLAKRPDKTPAEIGPLPKS